MVMIAGLGVLVAGGIVTVLSTILAAEFRPWSRWVVRMLVRFAVSRLPESRRERFVEEWHSHLNDVPGQIGKLAVAAGFVIAAYGAALDDSRVELTENFSQTLARLEITRSRAVAMLDGIQASEGLGSFDGIERLVADLRSSLATTQEMAVQLRSRIDAAATVPYTLSGRLRFQWHCLRLLRHCDPLEQNLDRNLDLTHLLSQKVHEFKNSHIEDETRS